MAHMHTTRRDTSQTMSIASPSPKRALPHDFNMTSSSFEPDYESTQNIVPASPDLPRADDTVSIELGRGVQSAVRRHGALVDSTREDSMYDLTGLSTYSARANDTPRYGQLGGSVSKPPTRRSTTMPTSASKAGTPMAKIRSTSAVERRSLSAMHAKVDSSFIETFDQPQSYSAKKSSLARVSARASVKHGIPTRFTTVGGLERRINEPKRKPSAYDGNAQANQTGQSFMLPDLPNITELVSGVRKDGTPVFSKTSKSRSRFTSASYDRLESLTITDHARIVSLPLPEDEKAIFASLQVLKERVAALEAEAADANEAADRYANENARLRSQLGDSRSTRRSGAEANSLSDDPIELRASLKASQDRLTRTEQKQTEFRKAIERMTSERDGLVTQLGVAFYTNEELKSSNIILQEEQGRWTYLLEELQHDKVNLQADLEQANSRLEQSQAANDKLSQQWMLRETELKKRISRRDQTIRDMRDVTREVWELHTKDDQARDSQSRKPTDVVDRDWRPENIMAAVERQVRKAQHQAAKRSATKTNSRNRRASVTRSRSRSQSKSRRKSNSRTEEIDSDIDSVIHGGDADRVEDTAMNMTRQTQEQEQDDNQDLTYLSFLDPAELSRLRQQLEHERRAAKMVDPPTTLPRKSSMKDLGISKTGVSDKTGGDKDEAINLQTLRNVRIQSPHTSDAMSVQCHHDMTSSHVDVVMDNERARDDEEMSAFIVPDMTISEARNQLDKTPRKQSFEAIGHDKKNDTSHNPPSSADPNRLIPISDREIDSSSATIRPSMAPRRALTIVTTQLECEVHDLRARLSESVTALNRLDPAKDRRRRVELKEQIDRVLARVDAKMEQVYRLYDVLEGQKGRVDAGDHDDDAGVVSSGDHGARSEMGLKDQQGSWVKNGRVLDAVRELEDMGQSFEE